MDIQVDGKWPIRLEVALGVQPGLPVSDWTWIDITDYCFKGSQPAPIDITYGRQDEMSETQPAAMTTTLDNHDGRFTPGNVDSPYWPYWKRGLPIRARLDGLNLTGMEVREVSGVPDSWAETPDHSSFAVTDLDVRIDVLPQSWRPSHGLREVLAGQWGTTINHAWYLAITNGVPELTWSANGTATAGTVAATAAVPDDAGRLTVRVTLDVDNGAGGRTATFYTGPSVDGPWTQLGAPVTQAGVTSVFNASVPLEVGAANGGIGVEAPQRAFTGMIYRFRLCAGINGAPVADPHFAAINPGTDALTDSAGRAWQLMAYARITDPAIRYSGQLAEITPSWPYGELDGDGESQVAITGAGILRRLGQGASPLHSSMRRGLLTNPKPPVAYWSCEDGPSSRSVISATLGGIAMTVAGAPEFASNNDFACSAPLPKLDNSTWTGTVPGYVDVNLQSQTRFLLSIPVEGEAAANNQIIGRVFTSGTAARFDVMYGNGFGGILGMKIYDPSGVLIHDGTLFDFDMNGQPCRIGVSIEQIGNNVSWALAVIKVPEDINTGSGSADSGLLLNRTAGVVRSVVINPDAAFKDSAVGHVSVNREIASGFDMLAELGAWAGETAVERFARLCAQEGIARWVSPEWTISERLGVQRIDTFPGLITEAVQADLSIMTETLDTLGLHDRVRTDLYDQNPVLVLDAGAAWGHIVNPFSPVDDDQGIRNDVEAQRVDGSSVRLTDAEHIAEHGRYDEQITVNVHRDNQLPDIAGWRLHLGTWPGMRYPELSPALDAHPELAATWLHIRAGDLVRVTGLPRQHPSGPVELLVQGWSESISPNFWTATANTSAAGPWDIAHAADVPVDEDPDRADTAGCVTATAAAPGVHLIYAATTKGPLWTDAPAEMPVPLRIDGEDVSVTVGPGVADSFVGRTVVNGWGTSTNGVPWTINGGSAPDFHVDGGSGWIDHPNLNVSRWAIAAVDPDDTYLNVTSEVRIAVTPTGAGIVTGATVRWVNASNNILCRLVFNPGNTMTLELRRRDALVETVLAAATPVAVIPFERVRVRIVAVGSTLLARLWRPEIRDEPSDWTLTATDTNVRTGRIGVFSRVNTGNTNTLPFPVEYFEFAVDNPQQLILPAGPGFARAHPVGRDIRLTRPAIVAW